MPESFIQINEGTGKKARTFQRTVGANTTEEEIGLIGEPYLASYIFRTGGVSTATANSHLFQIMSGASLKVRIRRIEIHQAGMATTAALMDTLVYRLSTAGTGGTVVTSSVPDPTDGASGATGMTLPTVKGTEGAAFGEALPYMMQTLGASTPFVNPIIVWDFDHPRSKPLISAAGTANGFAIKNITAIAGASVAITVWCDETNF